MLEDVEWGEFRIGDLFEIKSSKKIFHANNIEIFTEKQKNTYPYVVRMTTNNGIRGYINQDINYLNDENTFSFAQDTFKVYYQKEKYFTGNKVKILKAKKFELNNNISNFILSAFNFSLRGLSWGVGSTVDSIKDYKIKLPIKDRTINFSFMEKFIAELEASHLAELEAYLRVSNLKNYKLTEAEEKVLKEFENGEIEWGEFKIEDILDWQSQIKEINPLHIPNLTDNNENSFPFYGQSTVDNGVIDYIKLKRKVLNNEKGLPTILIHSNNQNIVFLESPFYLKDGHGATSVLQSKFLNKKNALCIMSCIEKVIIHKFSYQNKATKIGLKNTIVSIPIKNKKPNFDFMETFISAIQKLVIKDVVLYSEKKIKATGDVVGR